MSEQYLDIQDYEEFTDVYYDTHADSTADWPGGLVALKDGRVTARMEYGNEADWGTWVYLNLK